MRDSDERGVGGEEARSHRSPGPRGVGAVAGCSPPPGAGRSQLIPSLGTVVSLGELPAIQVTQHASGKIAHHHDRSRQEYKAGLLACGTWKGHPCLRAPVALAQSYRGSALSPINHASLSFPTGMIPRVVPRKFPACSFHLGVQGSLVCHIMVRHLGFTPVSTGNRWCV